MKYLLVILIPVIAYAQLTHADYYDLSRQEYQAKEQAKKAKEAAENLSFDEKWNATILSASNKIIHAHGLAGDIQQRTNTLKNGFTQINQVTFTTRDGYECGGDFGWPWGGEWHGATVNCIHPTTGKHLKAYSKL